jgi:hypothetical protein
MPNDIRTIHLGTPFVDNGRHITIRYSRATYACACGMPFHQIPRGDLCANFKNQHTGQREHWHREHLKQWKLIIVDGDGNELVRFGC